MSAPSSSTVGAFIGLNMSSMKEKHLADGIALMQRFCAENNLVVPSVNVKAKADWLFGECAYYRPTYIEICTDKCALIGRAGMSWSYPGYTVDKTPYGVIQHELGHHVDVTLSTRSNGYRGDFSINLRKETGEKPISGYCPNDGEWFAEIFRLFVTNPNLLNLIRPATYKLLRDRFVPVVSEPWETVIAQAPDRTRTACAKKVAEAPRNSQLF